MLAVLAQLPQSARKASILKLCRLAFRRKSFRCGKKVRQETMARLGELDAKGRLAARAVARQLIGIERQPSLFEDEVPDEPIEVDLKRLRLERGRRFGDVWLAWRLWQAVGLDRLLEGLLPPLREEISWATMAAVLVIARLCEPSSELHIAEDWFRRTALVKEGEPGKQYSNSAGRFRPHPEHRHRTAGARRPQRTAALHRPPRSCPIHPAGPPGLNPSRTPQNPQGHTQM